MAADGALGDLLETIERLRAKLLDLSLRNPLLNFKFSKRSLRIIDELPEQVFSGLVEGKSFSFAPLPEPKSSDIDEWFGKSDPPVDGPLFEGVQPELQSASDAPAKRSKKDISKTEWARHKSIEPSFELPIDPGAQSRRDVHRDAKLQTLEWYESLEALVRKLAQDARSAINETGSNMLFLTIGFLEWSESDDGQKRLAPLLLLPVELVRPEVRRGPRAYKLQANGDDVQINLALKQKLTKDFGVDLPEFSDEFTIEEYFVRVEEALGERAEWQIRRQMCLSLISQLGRLLLYHDLDPSNWPGGGIFARSDLVATLLGAMGAGQESENTISYEVGPETIEQELELPLVDRADSSQSEAIRLVMGGENLVIQGPPGTGKSQTITNLIAALMSQGKTVLFVAEKLAALQVVERRLQSLGFEPYCLELHSNKTQKKALLEAIRNRAEAQPPRASKDLRKLHGEAVSVRDSLNSYVEAVAAPQADEVSTADLLLSAGHHALQVGEVTRTIDKLRLPELVAKGLAELGDERFDIDGREQRLESLSRAASLITTKRPVSQSPWYGVSRLDLLTDDLPTVEAELARLEEALVLFQSQTRTLEEEEGFKIEPTDPEHVVALCDGVGKLRSAWPKIEPLAVELGRLLERLDLVQPHSWSTIEAILVLQEAAGQAPVVDYHHNQSGLSAQDAETVFRRLRQECAELRSAIAALETTLPRAISSAISAEELTTHATTLKSVSPVLRLFSKPWRAAKAMVIALGGSFGDEKADTWADRIFQLADVVRRLEALGQNADGVRVFGTSFRGLETDFEAIERVMHWRGDVRATFAQSRDHETLTSWLFSLTSVQIDGFAGLDTTDWRNALDWAVSSAGENVLNSQSELWPGYVDVVASGDLGPLLLGKEGADLEVLFTRFMSLEASARGLLDARASIDVVLGSAEDLAGRALDDEIELVRFRLAELDGLLDWVHYARFRNAATDVATAPLIRAAEEGYPLFADLPAVWRYCAYRSAALKAFKGAEALYSKNGSERNQERKQFRRLDEALMEARRTAIAAKVHSKLPPAGSGGPRVGDMTQMALLRHQWGLQKPRISIRDLMHRAGTAVQSLQPCFMMGPLSVAQYLRPGGLEFDVIVMDEASQMRPEDALSAIARGKQLVVVGDDKQLPPTNFFNKIGSSDEAEDYDEEVVGEKEESILSLAASKFKSRMLRWHYRSRHESLIAFSNSWFYDNRLIVYPTPIHDGGQLGIDFEYVPDGRFLNGVNDAEARRVAEAAVTHMRRRPEQSLIVVAMNSAQRERIRDHVDKLTRNDVAIVRAEEESARGEPFDVKNLENVQGDERDVIMLSMTYGPSPETGKVYQRFGPINSEYGHRRLNVLFSRARERMVVFSSMKSGEVLVGENAKLGVRALNGFLEYAETGVLPGRVNSIGSGREPDSDFEVAVAQALREKGYELVAQLGVDGFFLDLAVRNPDAPDTYLLGIECDGASYHSSRSARDRDRLRQDILEALGWRIERIWSTDWFQDPRRELARIIDALEDERAKKRAAHGSASPPFDTGEVAQHPESGFTEELIDGDPEYEDPEDALLTESPPKERRMSRNEARGVLVRLREETIKTAMPEVPPEQGLLRKVMLEALLERLPTDETEFRDMIPLKLRDGTDPEQFATFAKVVFRVLRQVD